MGKLNFLILVFSQIINDSRVSYLRNLTSGMFVIVFPFMKYTDFIDVVWYFFEVFNPFCC